MACSTRRSDMSDLALLARQPEIAGRSLWADARRRFLGNKAALVGLVIVTLVTFACFFLPLLGLRSEDAVNWDMLDAAPDFANLYFFGTDPNGRDLFVRTLHGGQVSLTVALVATTVSLIIGVIWGATAGFVGGRIDNLMMRFVDILYSIPFIFIVILLVVVFGRNIVLIYVAIGAVSWLDMARIVRGQTLSVRRKEYIEAAQASGVSSWRIITRHIVPNCLGPVVVYATLTVPSVMLTESFLSFIGLGVMEPQSSWGALIAEGTDRMEQAPWALLPGAILVITLLALNFIGDGLRDALDPKDR